MLSLFRNIQRYWRIRSLSAIAEKQPSGWSAIQKIAIVISSENAVNKNELDTFLETTGKYSEVFFIQTGKREPMYADWHCMTREQVNWLGLPLRKTLEGVKKQRFDLLIHAAPPANSYATMLSTIIRADLKCSAHQELSQARLLIKINDSEPLTSYLTQVVRYLEMIRV